MPVLSEYCIPFVKVGGKFIALKSINEDISAASGAIAKLGGEIETVTDYAIPNGDARRLAVIKKISQTPIKIPQELGQYCEKAIVKCDFVSHFREI